MEDRANRINVLWDKGRNMYAALFRELDDVRRDVGDEKLGDWCFHEARISLCFILDAAKLLEKLDAKRERDALARAKAFEQERRRAERAKPRDNENDNATKLENVRLRARVAELEEQIARDNETKPETKGNIGRPCKGDRPMTAYERLKAFRARQRAH